MDTMRGKNEYFRIEEVKVGDTTIRRKIWFKKKKKKKLIFGQVRKEVNNGTKKEKTKTSV